VQIFRKTLTQQAYRGPTSCTAAFRHVTYVDKFNYFSGSINLKPVRFCMYSTHGCLSRTHAGTHTRARTHTHEREKMRQENLVHQHSSHVACPTFTVCLKLLFVDALVTRTSPIITYQRRADWSTEPPPRLLAIIYLYIPDIRRIRRMDLTAARRASDERSRLVSNGQRHADSSPPRSGSPPTAGRALLAGDRRPAVVDDEIICPMAAELTERNGRGG